jgi:hypothetical protein
MYRRVDESSVSAGIADILGDVSSQIASTDCTIALLSSLCSSGLQLLSVQSAPLVYKQLLQAHDAADAGFRNYQF